MDNVDTAYRAAGNGEIRVTDSILARRPSSRRREIEEESVLEGAADDSLTPPDIEETLSGMSLFLLMYSEL